MPPENVIDNLQSLRHLLKHRGWCQGRYKDSHGRHCLVGALDALSIPLASRTRQVLSKALGPLYRSLIAFNDEPGRKRKEIFALIDRAIATEQKKARA